MNPPCDDMGKCVIMQIFEKTLPECEDCQCMPSKYKNITEYIESLDTDGSLIDFNKMTPELAAEAFSDMVSANGIEYVSMIDGAPTGGLWIREFPDWAQRSWVSILEEHGILKDLT